MRKSRNRKKRPRNGSRPSSASWRASRRVSSTTRRGDLLSTDTGPGLSARLDQLEQRLGALAREVGRLEQQTATALREAAQARRESAAAQRLARDAALR